MVRGEAGQLITDVQRQVRHPTIQWMAATLDGRVEATGAVFEATGRSRRKPRPRSIWPSERIMKEIRWRTRVVGAFPDGQSCLNLAAARLRYIAGTAWSAKCYMKMRPLYQPQVTQTPGARLLTISWLAYAMRLRTQITLTTSPSPRSRPIAVLARLACPSMKQVTGPANVSARPTAKAVSSVQAPRSEANVSNRPELRRLASNWLVAIFAQA